MSYAGKYSWPISLQGFFTFDVCYLLILIPVVHCYTVLVKHLNHLVFLLFTLNMYVPTRMAFTTIEKQEEHFEEKTNIRIMLTVRLQYKVLE